MNENGELATRNNEKCVIIKKADQNRHTKHANSDALRRSIASSSK